MHQKDAEQIQRKLANKVICKDLFGKVNTVCGIDVSYWNALGFCSAVIVDLATKKMVCCVNNVCRINHKYLPGFLMLREGPIILDTLRNLTTDYDILMIDGHGILHPRKCGMATYIGLSLDKPVIGIAKNLLCGIIDSNNSVIYDKQILGHVIQNTKKIYVSIGHKITLDTAVHIVKTVTLPGESYPEPLRLADQFSKKLKQNFRAATL